MRRNNSYDYLGTPHTSSSQQNPTIHRTTRSASYLPDHDISHNPRVNSGTLHRGRRPSRTSSKLFVAILAVCIIAGIVTSGVFLAGRFAFRDFKRAIISNNVSAARASYDKALRYPAPIKRNFEHRVNAFIMKTFGDNVRASMPDVQQKQALNNVAPYVASAPQLRASLIDERRIFETDREGFAYFKRIFSAAKPFVKFDETIAREYERAQVLIASETKFRKAQVLEKREETRDEARDLYASIPVSDELNHGQALQAIKRLDAVIPRLVSYTGPIRHIFTHCLIAWPQKAIASRSAKGYDIDCITVPEFNRLLEQLYQNNYVLININTAFEVNPKTGKVTRPELKLPHGKKPLILSVDDVTYDPRKAGNGMVDKLIVKNGKLYTFTAAKNSDTGRDEISDKNEVFPLLDAFIARHPDFSFKGARATLAMTGFIGCFGYRTDRLAANQKSEIPRAQEVARYLQGEGYTFASHSYSHHRSAQVSLAKVRDDSQKWERETQPIVGKTSIYIWPYGESVSMSDPKAKMLRNTFGFKMFAGVGAGGYQQYSAQAFLQDRAPVDGYSLRHREQSYKKMFDCRTVFDGPVRSKLNPSAGGVK